MGVLGLLGGAGKIATVYLDLSILILLFIGLLLAE
jgi:hypothetical protein